MVHIGGLIRLDTFADFYVKGCFFMQKIQYTITDENGIHARPAGLLVKAAEKFSSDITIATGTKEADAKRLFAVMGLGVKCGDNITLTAVGSDEKRAAEELESFLKANL